MKYDFMLIIVLIFTSCTQQKKVAPLSIEEIKEIQSILDLSPLEFLSLTISVQEIERIHSMHDSTIPLFKPISKKYKHPKIISIDGYDFFENSDSWVEKDDINYLIKNIDSKKPALPIFFSHSSFLNPEMTTLGANALFCIGVYRGKRDLYTNFNLLEKQDSLAKECKEWWKTESAK